MDKDFINVIIKETINAIHREINNINQNSNSVIKDIEIMIYNKQIEELKQYQNRLKLNKFNIDDLKDLMYRLDCLHEQTKEEWIKRDRKELSNDLSKILDNTREKTTTTKRIALK